MFTKKMKEQYPYLEEYERFIKMGKAIEMAFENKAHVLIEPKFSTSTWSTDLISCKEWIESLQELMDWYDSQLK